MVTFAVIAIILAVCVLLYLTQQLFYLSFGSVTISLKIQI
ncbi:hypothetical protein M2E15_1451 [Bacillus mycoides]|nr:hypothetical protein M2E15_1451 [Bacillus mycoides]OSX88951.1 hypothetical protein BTJ44_04629 [Bacillus mycoides]OSY14428.1 hypothetical protein BTJ48_04862 [Bacillus mycoides]